MYNICFISYQESTDGHIPLVRKDSSLSNEVFESFESEDFSHPETVQEESSTAMTTPTDERKASMELAVASSKADKTSQTDASTSTTSSPRRIKVSIEDSPDDGLGDSIAQGGSLTDRSKLDSMEDTDVVYSPRPEGTSEKFVVTKLSVDSAVLDDTSATSPGPSAPVMTQDFGTHSSVDGGSEEEEDDDEEEEEESMGSGRQTDSAGMNYSIELRSLGLFLSAAVCISVEHESLDLFHILCLSEYLTVSLCVCAC